MTTQKNERQTKQVFEPRRKSVAAAGLVSILAWMLIAFVPSSALAQASMHEVSWAHASPDNVSRFIVYVAETSGDQAGARIMDVGKPAGQPTTGGTMQVFRAIVSAELTEHVAVAAIGNDGTLSPLSAWSPLPPSQPGQPVIIP